MKSVRMVFFADTHLGFDYPIKPRIQRRRRGPDFFENFRKVLDYARETRPDLVLHGGDLFFRARIPQQIIDMVYAELFEFAGAGIPILIVPGNHERSILPVSLFLSHANIKIFESPKTYHFEFSGANVSLSGFPCERKIARDHFPSLLNETGWSKNKAHMKLLCIHQTVEGAQVGSTDFTFRRGKDIIRRIDLPQDATAVLSGHIHRAQVLGDLRKRSYDIPPVIYPGSTERTSFAERDEMKGFYEIEFAPSKEGVWGFQRLKFIPLPTRPMVDLILDGAVNSGNLEHFIRSEISNLGPDSIVRLRCHNKVDPAVKSLVTSQLLRRLLPETMNFQFSSEFRSLGNN